MDQFKPYDPNQDQREEKEAEDVRRVMEEQNADQHGANRADPGPDDISGADGDASLGDIEEITAQRHREDRQRDEHREVAGVQARQFKPQGPTYLEQSGYHQPQPCHTKSPLSAL